MTGKFALEMSQRQHAKAKLPLGNHCRQVGEIKMDNPLNSLTQNTVWKTWTRYRKEKGRHSETQYLVCISETSLSYSSLFCFSLPAACSWAECMFRQVTGSRQSDFSFSCDWSILGYSCFSSAKLLLNLLTVNNGAQSHRENCCFYCVSRSKSRCSKDCAVDISLV